MRNLLIALAAVALFAAPAFATHGLSNFQARQIRQAQRAAFNAQQAAQFRAAKFHAVPVIAPVYVPPQAFYAVPLQFNGGCNQGLQFNAGGCNQFFR